jgi:hypothetical protein
VVEAAATAHELWQAAAAEPRGAQRALVFTRSKAEADRLAALLGCGSYHSDSGAEADKADVLEAWTEGGGSPFLVGTSGLGAGLDYAHVRLVLHVGEPYGLVDFVQESGRAGRDGMAAESAVLLRHEWTARAEAVLEPNELMLQRFLGPGGCRRRWIDEYMDGAGEGEPCSAKEEACDRCMAGHDSQTDQRPPPPPSQQQYADDAVSRLEAKGPGEMLRRVRSEMRDVDAYISRLQAVRGQCLLCRMRGEGLEWQHRFGACRQVRKWGFIRCREAVMKRTRGRWIDRFDACFYCYQPQGVCERAERGGAMRIRRFGDARGICGIHTGRGAVDKARVRGWVQQRRGLSDLGRRESAVVGDEGN